MSKKSVVLTLASLIILASIVAAAPWLQQASAAGSLVHFGLATFDEGAVEPAAAPDQIVSLQATTSTLYLPHIEKAETAPLAGFWESTTDDEFYVTPDRAHVDNFAIRVRVSACNATFKITYNPQVAIINNTFAFTSPGGFYSSGTFTSPSTATGTDGLNNYFIPNCGTVNGGPWPWNATWQNTTQPAVIRTTEVVTSVEEIEIVPGSADKSVTITRVD